DYGSAGRRFESCLAHMNLLRECGGGFLYFPWIFVKPAIDCAHSGAQYAAGMNAKTLRYT
ncbi:MAG: hypothetical protein ACLUT8_08280, partial [Bifidobacterium adolescentis]